GGDQINHLLATDLNAFFRRNLRLERVDHVALGNLFLGGRHDRSDAPTSYKTIRDQWDEPDYRAKRAAFLGLHQLSAPEQNKLGDWEAAWLTCRDSPAQIRGHFRTLREGKRPPKRGRPKDKSRYRRPITDYRIDACFQPIELIPVTPAGIIMSAQPKSLPIT